MPELAEVEYFRKQWNDGLGQKIVAIELRPETRVFRGTDTAAMRKWLPRTVLQTSAAHGKQMLFQFSNGLWIGVHLGMSGRLRGDPPKAAPGKHDHLVLRQTGHTLVFTDPRQFGRVLFHRSDTPPTWWTQLPPAVTSAEFTVERMQSFLQRHARLPIKAALLLQDGFPGIGNWMADEILWRAAIHPRRRAGRVQGDACANLWRKLRWVSRRALACIGQDYSDPPVGWLLHERWTPEGKCPIHRRRLERATIGGRTTAWCKECQRR